MELKLSKRRYLMAVVHPLVEDQTWHRWSTGGRVNRQSVVFYFGHKHRAGSTHPVGTMHKAGWSSGAVMMVWSHNQAAGDYYAPRIDGVDVTCSIQRDIVALLFKAIAKAGGCSFSVAPEEFIEMVGAIIVDPLDKRGTGDEFVVIRDPADSPLVSLARAAL